MNDVTTKRLQLVLEEECPGDTSKEFPPSYRFGIHRKDSQERIGHITIRVGNGTILREYAGHISYEILPAHRGHRFAAEACQAILPVAHSLGIDPIRVTCAPGNVASVRTCEFCGGVFLGSVAVPPGNYVYANGGRQKLQYELPVRRMSSLAGWKQGG